MYLLWFAGYNNSVDFLGLYLTEKAARDEMVNAWTPWHRKNGNFKVSFVECVE